MWIKLNLNLNKKDIYLSSLSMLHNNLTHKFMATHLHL